MRTCPLKRHPDAKWLLARFNAAELVGNYIRPPYALSDQMTDPALGIHLAKLSGPPDGAIPGKFCDAEVFIFEAYGQAVMALAENSKRGSMWAWLTPEPTHLSFKGDKIDPKIVDFWPQFLLDLNAAMQWGHQPYAIVDGASLQYLVEKDTRLQLQALDEAVPAPPHQPPRRMR